ncbi:MAG TPA: beta-ketoacyl-[acyl-carrier-protein] synthase family protein [Vicinamibacterales bacterium]|nr:beta-ketoacyl-[acyl-carrier-protein] synthase family protein [Vicinamibacterales bacterium]
MQMFAKRIVVTGVGAVTPVGHDATSSWDALVEGRSGVAPISAFETGQGRPSYAAEVKDFAPERAGLPRRKLKMMGRQAQLAFAAAEQACADAGLTGAEPKLDPTRLGIILGVGMLNADAAELGRTCHTMRAALEGERFGAAAFTRAAATELFPLWLLRHIPNLAAAHASIHLDAQGPSNTIATGCVAGANAIGEAARLLARGEADVMLAGGTDARVSPLGTLRYRDLGWLATRDDIDPASISAPFDEDACGFVNGEGAGILVLETLEHAQARGARIYAELAAYAAANEAGDMLRPQAEGRALARAITQCAARSGVSVADVDAIFAPAPSVPGYDAAIASALRTVLNGYTRPAVTALRSLLGHTHAASGALDCVAAVKAIETSQVPATANLRRPIADLPFVTDAARRDEVSASLVCAYGFGGHAASLAFRVCPS